MPEPSLYVLSPTTFSTYGYETFALLGDGEWWLAAGNVLLSNALGLLALWIGVRLAGQFHGSLS